MASFWLSLGGVVLGGIITVIAAKVYYEKASRDLDRAAAELRRETRRVRGRLIDLFAALDEAGLIEVEWSETGDDIRGVTIKRGFGTQVTVSREGRGDQKPARKSWWRRVFGG